jgi:UrcA family protein
MSFQSTPSLHLTRIAAASRHVALVALAGAVAFATAANARAETVSQEEVRTRTVSYADLNLANARDTAELYSRLRHAADVVCGEYTFPDLRAKQAHAACAERALSDAVARVDDVQLTALHEGDKRIRVASRK